MPHAASKYSARQGQPIWAISEIADVQKVRVEALLADGLSVRDVAEETGIPKSTVHRF